VALLRPTPERLAYAVFAVACIGVAFGLAPFADVANVLPGLSRTDNTRLVIVGLPALALLCGLGLEDLRRRVPEGRLAVGVVTVSAGLLCLPLAWVVADELHLSQLGSAFRVAWGMETPPAELQVVRLSSAVLWFTIGGLALLLLALRVRGRVPGLAFGLLAVALVVVDLFRAGVGFNPAIRRDDAGPPPATGAIAYLQSRAPARYVALGAALPPDLSLSYGLYDARGYDFPIERRYRRLWESEINPALGYFKGYSGPILAPDANPRALRALSMFGVTDVLVGPEAPPLQTPGLVPAYRGPDAVVYSNRGALPRAFVVAGQRNVDSEDAALAAIIDPAFDARRTVIREGSGQNRAPRRPPGRARVLEYAPDKVTIAATSSQPATVVLSDIWFPGWEAKVDGEEADVTRVNYLFRGVEIAPGAHRVELSYEPNVWRFSWTISAVAGFGLVVVLIVATYRRRSG
jgi:Bacterial membrane protein YfhO